MSEKKFTPGQWKVGKQDHPIGYFPIYARIGVTKLACITKTASHEVGFGVSEAEHKANAHLIAAAPDMYEALVTTLENINSLGPAGALYDTYKPWAELVGAVLRKARGEE